MSDITFELQREDIAFELQQENISFELQQNNISFEITKQNNNFEFIQEDITFELTQPVLEFEIQGAVIVKEGGEMNVSLSAELANEIKKSYFSSEMVYTDSLLTTVNYKKVNGDVVYTKTLSYTGTRLDAVVLIRSFDSVSETKTLNYDVDNKLTGISFS